jgi:hypothetical protein
MPKKAAVIPKPVNLPSRRAENHGLDPSVQIIPRQRMVCRPNAYPPSIFVMGLRDLCRMALVGARRRLSAHRRSTSKPARNQIAQVKVFPRGRAEFRVQRGHLR